MKVLVFRIGSLGDNLVALPSIWAIKSNYPSANLYLLGNRNFSSKRVLANEIFENTDLFSGYLQYPTPTGFIGTALLPFTMLSLLVKLRLYKFDLLVYLAPSSRKKWQLERDRIFFGLAGIRNFIGMEGFQALPQNQKDKPIAFVPFEADLLLRRLLLSGIPTPPLGQGKMEMDFNEGERICLTSLLSVLPSHGHRNWIGIGPGSNQPVKIWPRERYMKVVRQLIEENDLWPVVLGGKEDQSTGEELICSWGRGYNFAGILSVRQSALVLEKCLLYLGNDTGTMHLAALMKTPCIAVFSSHSHPGQWFPYGQGHKVFYRQIDCAGCHLVECFDRKMECILSIQTDEVLQACHEVLGRRK